MNRQAVTEALKEAARLAFFGAVSALLSYATTKVASLDPNSVYAVVGTLVLRIADKYVHENPDIDANGLSPV